MVGYENERLQREMEVVPYFNITEITIISYFIFVELLDDEEIDFGDTRDDDSDYEEDSVGYVNYCDFTFHLLFYYFIVLIFFLSLYVIYMLCMSSCYGCVYWVFDIE